MKRNLSIAGWWIVVGGLLGACGDGDPPLLDGGLECGATTCDPVAQYCQMTPSASGGETIYVCRPLPESCGSMPDCACVVDEPCASSCSSNNSQITLGCDAE